MADSNQRHNSIYCLKVNGELSLNQEAIKGCITEFYEHLYVEENFHGPLLDGLRFSRIAKTNLHWLETF